MVYLKKTKNKRKRGWGWANKKLISRYHLPFASKIAPFEEDCFVLFEHLTLIFCCVCLLCVCTHQLFLSMCYEPRVTFEAIALTARVFYYIP